MGDFKTLRENYLSQWHELEFQSAFDTYVETQSVKTYGVYKEHEPSNIFSQDEKIITLYVEPVGFAFKETVLTDEYNNNEAKTLYSYDFRSSVLILNKKNPTVVKETTPFYVKAPYLSKNKNTEMYILLQLNNKDNPLPIGEQTITYTVTDVISRKSLDIIKEIEVVA